MLSVHVLDCASDTILEDLFVLQARPIFMAQLVW